MTKTELVKYLVPILLAIFVIWKCSGDKQRPGVEYAPEMIHSKAYETYIKTPGDNKVFKDGITALQPPTGSIPVGGKVFHIEESPEGYEESASLVNPIEVNEEVLARGKEVYTIYCTPCHGSKGDGQGSIVVGSDFRYAPPATKFDALPADLTDGKMFYSITYGKNLMGSYASQVSHDDRWKVIHYIRTLDKGGAGNPIADEGSEEGTTEVSGTEGTETAEE